MAEQDAVEYSVFDGDVGNSISPHRPTLGNLGGGAFEEDLAEPTDPTLFPTADAENQCEKVLYGLAQTGFALNFMVTFSGGTPSIAGFSTVGTRLELGDLTVTDNGAGDTTISWPADYLIPGTIGPILTLNEDVEIDRQRAILAGDGLSVTVKTKLSTTGTDCAFSVLIHGG